MALGLGVMAPVAPFALHATMRRRSTLATPGNAPLHAAGTRSDEELVRVCQSGDAAGPREGAFRELVERYQDRAFWIARGIVGNDDDARDVAQEAFIRVFRSVDRFDLKLKFYTWFYQIVVNLGIDHLRRAKKRPRVSLDELAENGDGQVEDRPFAPESGLERAETARRVARVLGELPAKYRSVIVLRDLEGLDGKEVAEVAGATHATVRWRLHKARQMFREAWERIYGAGP